ncbi:peptidoglycan DD-metalloendopeptidase family protein [Streptomyces finlayi]|uniref:Peptidoglycan DD-metalloendopeptidase family protein n=1 Tax=Streptomyces finlayi TaxID=67296 RepID=A0A7G7BJH4_9ACTN|nr:M23 family metallopeptidase [Streptomyces finlayi]QNE75489.1 peptidoglycan DD-metalloendopeptidase family protein [Streptomyces finlayi]
MNDQHPHAGNVDYDNHPPGSFDTDPLFGALPGHHDSSYDSTPAHGHETGSSYGSGHDTSQGATYGYDNGFAAAGQDHSGAYDSTQWDTGAHQTASYDSYAAHPHETYETHEHQPQHASPQAQPAQQQYDGTGQWDTSGWGLDGQAGQAEQWGTTDTGAFPTTTFATTGYGTGTYATSEFVDAGTDTGAYDATAWNSGATPEQAPYAPEQVSYSSYEQQPAEQQATYEPFEAYDPYRPDEAAEFSPAAPDTDAHTGTGTGTHAQTTETHESYESYETHETYEAAAEPAQADESDLPTAASPSVTAPRPADRTPRGSAGSRGRRRTPAKRSALLTVAVPSACVMSVAGIAAASVSGIAGGAEKKDETTSMAAADPGTVKPVTANNKLDTQLANLSADADDFADRASRTQERIDLRERQVAEKKKRDAEAARREALRPKFSLPVTQHGLSAYYGQAGVNWMSVHTGVDFPVGYGAPVLAATDGTVRTQFNSAYGNMIIVTAADGTETWYCHLSSTRIRSGSVQAGDTIGYAGDSGNSTGPHLHFEVRPGGGSAIDPMPWFRSHNLNPN